MELFKKNPWAKTSAEDLPTTTSFAPVENSDSEETPKNWLMLASLVIAAIAFAILVAALGTWLYHREHKPAPAPASTQALPPPPPTGLQQGQ